MSETAEKLKAELSQLSEEDRVELAHFLLGSLEPGGDTDWEDAWTIELERRFEEIRSGKAVGIPAEQVFNDLREKYP